MTEMQMIKETICLILQRKFPKIEEVIEIYCDECEAREITT